MPSSSTLLPLSEYSYLARSNTGSYHMGLAWVQLILTHEHADAILGLDNVRGVQPVNLNNDIPPMPVFVAQHTMDRFAPLWIAKMLFKSFMDSIIETISLNSK